MLPLLEDAPERRFSEPNRWGTGELEEAAVRPELVVEVRYDKVQGNRFRHGTKLLRFRPDKDAERCTWEQARPKRRARRPYGRGASSPSFSKRLTSDGRRRHIPLIGSPTSAIRARIVSTVNASGSTAGTSSQRSGADTRASGVGRTEYAHAIVRSRAFCPKSTKTPRRSATRHVVVATLLVADAPLDLFRERLRESPHVRESAAPA